MNSQRKDFFHFISFLRRRKWQIAIPTAILLGISAAVALLLPASYRSTATILIEEQEIPTELVRSTITSYADQRLQVISQQVMTRANLQQIIKKFDLYKKLREREISESVIQKLRKNIALDMLSADVIDKRSGNKTAVTIAFVLSYDGETPEVAQRVTNELVSLYLNENLKNRQQQTEETSKFLGEEAKRLAVQVAEIETNLAKFKENNAGQLPELAQLNLASRDRTEAEITEADRIISSLVQRKAVLESQIAQVKPYSSIISSAGERVLEPEERLRLAQSQYATLSSVYSSDHPDVQRLRREIEGLKRDLGNDVGQVDNAREIDRLQTDLVALRERYSDEHPDVIKLKDRIAVLEKQSRQSPPATAVLSARAARPDNPAFLTLKAQLDGANEEIRSLRGRQVSLRTKLSEYDRRLRGTPQTERAYLDISREYENASRRYQEVKSKLMEAQVAQELERDRKGERFALIEPPDLPEKPFKPNRIALMTLGSILAIGSGLGYAGIIETLDRSIRGIDGLSAAIRAPVLGSIPYIASPREATARNRRSLISLLGVLALAMALIAAIHFFIVPLDVMFFALMRKIGL
jgi:polysaccharide biosynthesis transport protein